MPRTDRELLNDFVASADEASFGLLAERHLALIYGAALRRSGDREIAEEAAQNVLSLLVRKAADLVDEPDRLPVWLHRAATLEAANLSRSEVRHRKRLQEHFEKQHAMSNLSPDSAWDLATPVLDEALQDLPEKDRRLVIMHYLQGMTHAEIAKSVGKSTAAVQRQCHRCMDKLAALLKKRQAGIAAVALGSLLASESAKAAPAALVTHLPAAAFAAPGITSLPLVTKSILLMTAKQKAIIAAASVALIAAVPIGFQQAKISRLESAVQNVVAAPGDGAPNAGASGAASRGVPTAVGAGSAATVAAGEAPDEALKKRSLEIIRMSNSLGRSAAWAELIGNANADELEVISAATLDWWRSGGQMPQTQIDVLKFREGQLFGPAKMEGVTQDPNGSLSTDFVRYMRGWASASPFEAQRWLDGLEEGSVKDKLTTAWFESAVSEKPQLASQLYANLPEKLKVGGAEPLMHTVFKEGGIDAVQQWFNETVARDGASGSPVLQQAFDKMAYRLAQIPGGDAIRRILLDPASAPFLTSNAFASATRHITRSDPGMAIDLVAELSTAEAGLHEGTMRGMISRTVTKSTETTINNLGAWLDENPTHPLYDMTTRYFVQQAAREDPENAARWAETITDPSLRAEAKRSLGN